MSPFTKPWSPFKLERFFARYEFNVDHVLCGSDCETMAVRELLALEPDAEARLMELGLGYTESVGSPALREAVSAIYTTIDPDEVLVFVGAEEAIFLFMHAALAPGDHVVVQWPCYQSLTEVAQGLGCRVDTWQADLSRAGAWLWDLDKLHHHLRAETRALVVNTPHNPTGDHMSEVHFRDIVTWAQEHDVILFSDEVYRESEYREQDRLPAACDLDARAVSLGVLSKTYGLPGLRVGWVATHNAPLLARMAQLKDYTTICAPAPSEFLATLALRHRDDLVARTRGLLLRNLEQLTAFMERHATTFTWVPPDAGPIAFPRLAGAAAALGDTVFCERLAQEAGILLLPGSVYDVPQHVRFGFGREDVPAGLARLDQALTDLAW